jgi:hypothetical protein
MGREKAQVRTRGALANALAIAAKQGKASAAKQNDRRKKTESEED